MENMVKQDFLTQTEQNGSRGIRIHLTEAGKELVDQGIEVRFKEASLSKVVLKRRMRKFL
jgi:hypothetical protein